MQILLDTNILGRYADTTDKDHSLTVDTIAKLVRNGHELIIIPQSLVEFWAVATRPLLANGLGMTQSEAAQELQGFKTLFPLLNDTSLIYGNWEGLVARYVIEGRQTFDARIVAAMISHRIGYILTFNIKHFSRFTEITAIDPATV